MQTHPLEKTTIAAWLLMGAAMIFVLKFSLLPGLLAGLLVLELVLEVGVMTVLEIQIQMEGLLF